MMTPETIAKIKSLMNEAFLYEEDLEETFILGGGPGGQKTNKTSSAINSTIPNGANAKSLQLTKEKTAPSGP